MLPTRPPAVTAYEERLQTLEHVRHAGNRMLKQCGDELTRENVMKQAASLQHLELPMLLPGITINTSPTNFASIRQAQMRRFDGERYVPFGPILSGTIG